MFQHTLSHSDGIEFCKNEYDESNHWLRATWQGFVTPQDATQGATENLEVMRLAHTPYLLNDNSRVVGPWFDSAEWLERVWVPQAANLGLRYVAHVMQPDANADITTVAVRHQDQLPFEIQIFRQVSDAEEWLRSCQTTSA